MTRECANGTEVFDIVRRRYVACTPEEWVRQQLIHYLHFQLGYPLELMQVEGSISLNGMARRCDIVIFRQAEGTLKPVMIVECKQPSIPLNQKVLDQTCRYNIVLKVPLFLLTNGKHCLCVKVDFVRQNLTPITLPNWDELSKVVS